MHVTFFYWIDLSICEYGKRVMQRLGEMEEALNAKTRHYESMSTQKLLSLRIQRTLNWLGVTCN
jgi:hypothetical protein